MASAVQAERKQELQTLVKQLSDGVDQRWQRPRRKRRIFVPDDRLIEIIT
jgi:hypothetical protein